MEEGRMEKATGESSLVPPEERPRTRTTTTTRTIGQTLKTDTKPGLSPVAPAREISSFSLIQQLRVVPTRHFFAEGQNLGGGR